MDNEAILNYYMYNSTFLPSCDDRGFVKATSPLIYEVIRIIDGVPIFLEDHLERMRKSAKLIGKTIRRIDEEIKDEIHKLIAANSEYNLNIKLLCGDLDQEEQTFIIYFIRSSYPEKEMYESGIHTILYYLERENPNAKIVNNEIRKRINEEIKKQKAYEALLVNNKDYITEGSRSNMFFVKGSRVYTAPPGDVLLGITRNEIMKICKEENIHVVEEEIHQESLKSLDGAFMTGTSVNVLPITTINNIELHSTSNPIIKRISEGYLRKIQSYINERKDCVK